MAIDIPTSAIDSFNTEQQRDIRRLAEIILANVPGGTGYKYYVEDGAAADSGTIISDSEVAVSVGSVDSDIVSSINSALIGGEGNSLIGAGDSAIVGGSGNTLTSFQSVVIGGTDNTIMSGSSRSAVIGGDQNTIAENAERSVVLGGFNNYINVSNATIAGGERCLAGSGANNSFMTGQDGVGHRQWAAVVAGGVNASDGLSACQTAILSGTCRTVGTTPANFYTGNTQQINMLPNSAMMFRVIVTVVRSSDFATQGLIYSGTAKRIGSAAPVIVWSEEEGRGGDAALDAVEVTITAGAEGVVLGAVGLAATTLQWGCTVLIQEIQLT